MSPPASAFGPPKHCHKYGNIQSGPRQAYTAHDHQWVFSPGTLTEDRTQGGLHVASVYPADHILARFKTSQRLFTPWVWHHSPRLARELHIWHIPRRRDDQQLMGPASMKFCALLAFQVLTVPAIQDRGPGCTAASGEGGWSERTICAPSTTPVWPRQLPLSQVGWKLILRRGLCSQACSAGLRPVTAVNPFTSFELALGRRRLSAPSSTGRGRGCPSQVVVLPSPGCAEAESTTQMTEITPAGPAWTRPPRQEAEATIRLGLCALKMPRWRGTTNAIKGSCRRSGHWVAGRTYRVRQALGSFVAGVSHGPVKRFPALHNGPGGTACLALLAH